MSQLGTAVELGVSDAAPEHAHLLPCSIKVRPLRAVRVSNPSMVDVLRRSEPRGGGTAVVQHDGDAPVSAYFRPQTSGARQTLGCPSNPIPRSRSHGAGRRWAREQT